jgi:hypothetical protein
VLDAAEVTSSSVSCSTTQINTAVNFTPLSFFPLCQQLGPNCNISTLTNAEIIDVSGDGNTLLYSDDLRTVIGFVDITNPETPLPLGATPVLSGRPTAIAVKGNVALAPLLADTGSSNRNGSLVVIDIATQSVLRTLALGGQPDAISVSPDGTRALIAIENEGAATQDPNANEQIPDGFVTIVDISDANVANWSLSNVTIPRFGTNVNGRPEPENIDINAQNIAAVTLQETNAVALVNLNNAQVSGPFLLGSEQLSGVDLNDDEPRLIDQTQTSTRTYPRQPDGIVWINNNRFVTVNEGDEEFTGTRDFSIFDTAGNLNFTAGSEMEREAASVGHYPDQRSGERGIEPNTADLEIFGDERYLFVNTERAHLTYIYNIADATEPVFKQVLPGPTRPEGVKAIPSRNLLAVSGERDARGNYRSGIALYRLDTQAQTYPVIKGVDRADGSPIPFGALSGLAADPVQAAIVYAVEDGYFDANRILEIDMSVTPASLRREIRVTDPNNLINALPIATVNNDRNTFDGEDRDDLKNADGTVNLDFEGIAMATGGGFWLVAEGDGTFNTTLFDPINSRNRIFKTDADGVITDIISLPDNVNLIQSDFGFAGVAEGGGKLYVPFERDWNAEIKPRIGIYDIATQLWSFVFYTFDPIESQNGGGRNLSGITALGNGKVLILERDDQGGPDAAIKRLYEVDLSGVNNGDTVTKTLRRDLIASGDIPRQGGQILERVEGVTVNTLGEVIIVTDNDGADESNGETALLNLGDILP